MSDVDRSRPEKAQQEKHCETCYCGRRAPVQGTLRRGSERLAPGSISWAEHLEAYIPYAAQYGLSQSAERLAERGGFGHGELVGLLGHEPTTFLPIETSRRYA